MMEAILEVKDLVKKYDKVVAVNGISFALRQGTCFGLLGPNGAGKTTLLHILAFLLRPSSGQLRFKDQPVAFHAGSLHQLRRQVVLVGMEPTGHYYENLARHVKETGQN